MIAQRNLKLINLLSTGELLRHTSVKLFEALAGFILGTSTGAIIGLALWYSRTIADIARPYIAALASVPIFALAPMIIVWFGIGLFSKIMLAFLSSVVLVMVQSYQRYLRLMNVVGANRTQIFRFLVVPSS
ncbi:MAG: ABC transporter permease, partial [Cyanobacteria bacterium]|nr:ABC transporter permease [Cyanobacteriota bacterium]